MDENKNLENEIVEETAEISFEKGVLLVIEARDDWKE